jgi:transporter family protein
MWIAYSLLAALAGATVMTLTKAGLKNVDSSLGLAVQSILIVTLSWGTVLVQGNLGDLTTIDRRARVYLLLSGVVTAASYLLLFRAPKLGEASRVVPLDRLSLVFALVLTVAFLKEKVNVQVLAGSALMAAGALVIAVAKN